MPQLVAACQGWRRATPPSSPARQCRWWPSSAGPTCTFSSATTCAPKMCRASSPWASQTRCRRPPSLVSDRVPARVIVVSYTQAYARPPAAFAVSMNTEHTGVTNLGAWPHAAGEKGAAKPPPASPGGILKVRAPVFFSYATSALPLASCGEYGERRRGMLHIVALPLPFQQGWNSAPTWPLPSLPAPTLLCCLPQPAAHALPALTPDAAPSCLPQANWLAKHRSARPAVGVLLAGRQLVTGDPASWARLVAQVRSGGPWMCRAESAGWQRGASGGEWVGARWRWPPRGGVGGGEHYCTMR